MPGRRYQSRIDLLQGTLDFIILQTLRWGTQHGYGISHAINANSQDAFKVETGSLYPALHRLEKQGWVASEWKLSEKGQRAKYYKQSRWGRLVDAMRSIMQPFDPAEDRAPR
jgi:PadR family transcriptional regulator PadR